MNHGIRLPCAVVTQISSDDGIGVWLQLREEMTSAQLIAGAAEVSPERLRNPRTAQLSCQERESLLPLRLSCRAVSLLVINNGKAVVDIGPIRREFQCVLVVRDCPFGVASTGVIFGQRLVSRCARRALFQNASQKIFGIPLLRG